MADPVLHVLAGPNGAGKSTLWRLVLEPDVHLPWVNADEIASARWPGDAEAQAYRAADVAATHRSELLRARRSFATETVFSHASKVDLVRDAVAAGYLVTLHVVAVPVVLSVARVADRVENGGHAVPEAKVRERHERLWAHVVDAARIAEQVLVYDNTRAATPFRPVAELERGALLWAEWPAWTPPELLALRR